jgi:hypothetical protein
MNKRDAELRRQSSDMREGRTGWEEAPEGHPATEAVIAPELRIIPAEEDRLPYHQGDCSPLYHSVERRLLALNQYGHLIIENRLGSQRQFVTVDTLLADHSPAMLAHTLDTMCEENVQIPSPKQQRKALRKAKKQAVRDLHAILWEVYLLAFYGETIAHEEQYCPGDHNGDHTSLQVDYSAKSEHHRGTSITLTTHVGLKDDKYQHITYDFRVHQPPLRVLTPWPQYFVNIDVRCPVMQGSPRVVAPSSEPRTIVETLDLSGFLAVTTGLRVQQDRGVVMLYKALNYLGAHVRQINKTAQNLWAR